MRNRGHIPDEADVESCSLQGSESGFTARARPLDIDFNAAHTVFLGFFRAILCSNLGSERCTLA